MVVIAVGARGWALERKVRRQTAAAADLERRRSRILEDINGSRPLAEIIEQITELVSFMLEGAPCWCEIAEERSWETVRRSSSALRIVRRGDSWPFRPALGKLFAAFDPLAKPPPSRPEALAMGAGLATLAIETRRLYSDLVHRSEFDLLTDMYNRFSLDSNLDAQIEEARARMPASSA